VYSKRLAFWQDVLILGSHSDDYRFFNGSFTTRSSRMFKKRLFDENRIFIWDELMNDRARLLAKSSVVVVLIGSLLAAIIPFVVGRFLEGLQNQVLSALVMAACLFTTLELFLSGIGYLRQQTRERFFQEEFWFLPQAISRLYFSRPLSMLTESDSEIDGGGVESLRDKVWVTIGSTIFQIVPGYAQITFALTACLSVNFWLMVVALLYIVHELWRGRVVNNYIQQEMQPLITGFKRWERRMLEWWGAVSHVKYNGAETKILAMIHDEVQETLRGDDALWRKYFAKVVMKSRLRSFAFALGLYAIVGYYSTTGSVSLSGAILVFFSFERMRGVLGEINDVQREVQFNLASVAKYRSVLTQPVPYLYNEGVPFTGETIGIEFKNVSLTVADGQSRRLILRDVSIAIKPGEKVGIVGPSGAGKSQLMSLLVRARDPDAGQVLVGDDDIRKWSTESLLRYYGIIMQRSEPFEDSLLGNLLFGVSHLDLPLLEDSRLVETLAAESLAKAGLDAASFPQGLKTNIGYKGMRLSGGQQQRLQIAAAHFKLGITPKRPRIILADEPTSSLDSLSELTVMEHLQESLPDGTTMLMVAHRLSTVAHMDRIIFVRPLTACTPNKVQVTVHSSLAELYAQEALFREMADAQGFVPS
jgi:ABC-type multidrug transport system fused ATPase/permease subunit